MYSFLFKFQIDFLFLFTHNIHQLKYHYAGLLNLYCYSTLTNHDVSRRKKKEGSLGGRVNSTKKKKIKKDARVSMRGFCFLIIMLCNQNRLEFLKVKKK